ncbi:hypothetical protein PSTT_11860 [Puccinia striiformis]|uniref:Uncharacterized protein n=1 Tax=Puccinia striiformis TaxID=27350 RepID=A0A2S4UYG2_9BASI|nr:hypothetical protein PSTT_11860 [Puccinia striiformis]
MSTSNPDTLLIVNLLRLASPWICSSANKCSGSPNVNMLEQKRLTYIHPTPADQTANPKKLHFPSMCPRIAFITPTEEDLKSWKIWNVVGCSLTNI